MDYVTIGSYSKRYRKLLSVSHNWHFTVISVREWHINNVIITLKSLIDQTSVVSIVKLYSKKAQLWFVSLFKQWKLINTFVLWSSFRISILNSQKRQKGDSFHAQFLCYSKLNFWTVFSVFLNSIGTRFVGCVKFSVRFSTVFFSAAVSDILAFFGLQIEFIKCWNKLKMQIIIFIPPSADSSSPPRASLFWFGSSLFFTEIVAVNINYLNTLIELNHSYSVHCVKS